MADREIHEREIIHDGGGPERRGSGAIIGLIVGLIVVVILLFVFLGGDDNGSDGDGGGGGGVDIEAPDVEAPDDVDVNVDGGDEGEGG